MIRGALLFGLAVLIQDDIDPSRYAAPADARHIEVKEPTRPAAVAYLGIGPAELPEDGGVTVGGVAEDGPAGKAGLRPGDRVMAFGAEEVESFDELMRLVRSRKPGERVTLRLRRDGAEVKVEVTLGAHAGEGSELPVWTKRTFALAVVPIEFPDCGHNPDFSPVDFERLLFSRGRCFDRSPSGERVFGSLADYYAENSYGRLTVLGRCFDWVMSEVRRDSLEERRLETSPDAPEFLQKAVARVEAQEGEDCFDGYDGVVFIYAGRQTYQRMRMLWPHRATVRAGRRTLPYYLNAEGGRHFNAIGVHAHEFGHMLGLPDQYGRRHATGVGKWCVMGVGHMGGGASRNARPFHLCVWCKERLGWVRPVPIDPREAQWLKLGAIEEDPAQAFKIVLTPDGSSCYYLENRQRRGFDRDLEGVGLLIWKAGPSSLDLIEAHGLKVPDAALVETEEIPFPSGGNRHFTPDTKPASAAGVYLTDIVRKDGVVYFKIGTVKRVGSRDVEGRRDY